MIVISVIYRLSRFMGYARFLRFLSWHQNLLPGRCEKYGLKQLNIAKHASVKIEKYGSKDYLKELRKYETTNYLGNNILILKFLRVRSSGPWPALVTWLGQELSELWINSTFKGSVKVLSRSPWRLSLCLRFSIISEMYRGLLG